VALPLRRTHRKGDSPGNLAEDASGGGAMNTSNMVALADCISGSVLPAFQTYDALESYFIIEIQGDG